MTQSVDSYLINGCMRCKYGGTPHCKVLTWTGELQLLRQIALEAGLTEEVKWGVPVYTLSGKNIISVNALKDSANIIFYKGVLLKDEYKILQQQGSIQAGRILKFTNIDQILKIKEIIKSYIIEAISIEQKGLKVSFKKNPEPIPKELLEVFKEDLEYKEAFYKLTPSRQRGYIIYFSQPLKTNTKLIRIQKFKQRILKGIGLNDRLS